MEPSRQHISAMLESLGLPREHSLARLPGGANNRVYQLDCGCETMLLKEYFRDARETQDRLRAEFSFCRFARDAHVPHPPRPLACDEAAGLAIYEFIAGRAVTVADVGRNLVEAAADFFRQLNARRDIPSAGELPPAAEACFSLAEHLACVERRLGRLEQLDNSTPAGRDAQQLVRGKLLPKWSEIQADVRARAREMKLPPEEALAPAVRCISPSDFGFHNAIISADGATRFIDFEYAGWDDPAKMACDFFCQVALPVPAEFLQSFARSALSYLSDVESCLGRIFLLLPVYRMKWCCIMLNEFLPQGSRRREFAASAEHDSQARQRVQLEKVQQAMRQL